MSIFDKIARLLNDPNLEKDKKVAEPTASEDTVRMTETQEPKPEVPEKKDGDAAPTSAGTPVTATEEPEAKTKAEEKPKAPKADNIITKKADLLAAIREHLKANFRGERVDFGKKELTIWVQDNLFFNALADSDFKDDLAVVLYNELGYEFGKVEIKGDTFPSGLNFTEVYPTVFLQVKAIGEVTKICKAVIFALEDCGSTIEECYELDSEMIKALSERRYNIGVGGRAKLHNGQFRTNHIAIDDDTNGAQYENNKYVSRSHAHISYSDKFGFMLYVEMAGTRMAGKRTRIFRGDKIIEMNNVHIPEMLEDNDVIELSKTVRLLFKQQ